MDFSYLNEISDGDLEFIQEFVSTFENNNKTIFTDMQSSLSNGDSVKIGKLAHQLKPTIEMLGMTETLEIITRMNDNPSTTTQEDLDFVILKSDEALIGLKKEFNID